MQILFQKPNFKKLKKQGLMAVDMHLHSSYSDSTTTINLLLQRARRLNIGLAITDHNHIMGSVKASTRQSKVMIIPAIEVTSNEHIDLIPYFYSTKELVDFYNRYISRSKRPNRGFDFNKLKWSVPELLDILSKYNCKIGLPHPFAPYPKNSHSYFTNKDNQKLIKKIDFFEALNSIMTREKNLKAIQWIKELNAPFFGSSDGHILWQIGHAVTISESHNLESFLESIKQKKNFVIGEEVRGFSKVLSNLVILKNNLRIRVDERSEEIKLKLKEKFTDTKEEIIEELKERKEDLKEDIKELKQKLGMNKK